ncbi:hypothetical protein RN001_010572 [Aquatica leii]|uniref:CN hydrolase domain-containing protein n=1 Tax=Aquatica leii TaxID=1421715 RepID=A0AAN7P9U2_9COLE|nr:hypothetical protein RN001_010572 [Aquatica leii]
MKCLSGLFPIFFVTFWAKTVLTEYTAAVVEYYPDPNKQLAPEEKVRKNIDGYLKILDEIEKKHKLDIIVFPEATLTITAFVETKIDISPYTFEISDSSDSLCTTQETTSLTRLACAAQKLKTYMVINLYERARCKSTSECSKIGWDFYNTNIVLDRNGSVISKYRKFNLFGEYLMNRTKTADIAIFETDFGEKFATFTCFDILFKQPALDLIRKHQITNIVYPTMWFSQLPFYTSLQTQFQWAYAVNATGGTGIYQGTKGPLVYDIFGTAQSKAFVATVSQKSRAQARESTKNIDKKAKEMDHFYFQPNDATLFTSKPIKFGEQEINDTVCSEGFCCNFLVSLQWNAATTKNYYVYHMVAFNGILSFAGAYNGGIELCGVIACMTENLDSCSKRFPNYDEVSWPATIRRIRIKAQFDIDDNKFQFPNSLLSNIKPLPVEDFDWTNRTLSTTIERTYTLKTPQNRLMTFGIFGRDFSRDSPISPVEENSYTLTITLILILIASIIYAKAVVTEYTAAVIEYYPDQNKLLEPEERLRRNVDGYLKIFDEIQRGQLKPDIVVFPESTLTANAVIRNRTEEFPYTVEITNSTASLCTAENSTFLTRLACAAQRSKTYMVINLSERARCQSPSKCSEDGWDFYNSNIALDRNGSVISKYRKYNLFGEYLMNQTQTADISIFDTDFGATFAMFTCFDILFKEPTLNLIYKHRVNNIIFPSMWFSELPFLTAVQTQQQWAYAVNATVLAAGANNPKVGSGGTGIYQGTKGPLVFDIEYAQSKAFVATLSHQQSSVRRETTNDIDKKAKQMDGFYLKTDNLKPYTSRTVQFGEKEINENVCHEDFCCNFKMLLDWNKATTDHYYVYHLTAYKGVRSFSGVYDGGVDICGVVACRTQNLSSCGKRFPNYENISWPLTFKHIQIKAQFEIDDKKFQYPNSLRSNIKPLPVADIEWTSTTLNNTIERTYTLKEPQNRLMTFAIYGRDFSRDKYPSRRRNAI